MCHCNVKLAKKIDKIQAAELVKQANDAILRRHAAMETAPPRSIPSLAEIEADDSDTGDQLLLGDLCKKWLLWDHLVEGAMWKKGLVKNTVVDNIVNV